MSKGNIVSFRHANCMDGAAAFYIFLKAMRESEKLPDVEEVIKSNLHLAFNYGENKQEHILRRIGSGDTVYFLDMAPQKETLERLLKNRAKVVILDHHQTSIVGLAGVEHRNLLKILDPRRSGAGITWDYMSELLKWSPGRPDWVNYIERVDLEKFPLDDREVERFLNIAAYLDSFRLKVTRISGIINTFDHLSKVAPDKMAILGKPIRDNDSSRPLWQDAIKKPLIAKIEIPGARPLTFPTINYTMVQGSRELSYKLKIMAESAEHGFAGTWWNDREHDREIVRLCLRSASEENYANHIDLEPLVRALVDRFSLSGGGHNSMAQIQFSPEQFNALVTLESSRRKVDDLLKALTNNKGTHVENLGPRKGRLI